MNLEDELVFLTMNEDLDLGPIRVEKGEDLPLLRTSLIQGVRDKTWKEAIPYTEFLKGMALCFYVNRNLALDKGYDQILVNSPFIPRLIQDIMLKIEDQDLKKALLGSLKDLGIQEEDLTYLLTSLEEKDLAGKNLQGQDLDDEVSRLVQAYNQVGKDSPFYPQALLHMSSLYAGTGRYIKARYYAKEVLTLQGQEEVKTKAREAVEELEDYANMEAVQSYLHVQDLDRAQAHLNKVSGNYPNPDQISFFKASIALAKEDYEGALKDLKEALDIAENPYYYERMGLAYLGLEEVEKAREAYEKALETGFDPYTIHHNLSYLYGEENLDQAIYHGEAAFNLKNSKEMADWLNFLENLKKGLDTEDNSL